MFIRLNPNEENFNIFFLTKFFFLLRVFTAIQKKKNIYQLQLHNNYINQLLKLLLLKHTHTHTHTHTHKE